MGKSINWSKLVIHEIPITLFLINNKLYLLKKEIETFNPEVKLLKNPRWLFLEENRQSKKHASIIIIIENTN